MRCFFHDYPEARKFYNQSLEIKRELGDRSVMAATLFNLATTELNERHLDVMHLGVAKRPYDESLGILKESGDWLGIANTLYQLYKIEYWKGNYEQAKKFYDQSQEIKHKLDQVNYNHLAKGLGICKWMRVNHV